MVWRIFVRDIRDGMADSLGIQKIPIRESKTKEVPPCDNYYYKVSRTVQYESDHF
jgi:hypothetical protein